MKHIIVVGGGASGLVAAIAAARNGAKVTLLEQKERVGKKILSTGNGRCNFTNKHMTPECFRGDNMQFITEILNQFGYEKVTQFFEELGVLYKVRNGYIYPISDQATTILDVLRMELQSLGVKVFTDACVTSISRTGKQFLVLTDHSQYKSDAVILATGGKAAPSLGSDGKGYALAKHFGHQISPVVPALVQLRGIGSYFKQVAGVRTQAKVSLYVNGDFVASDIGELQLTNYGISGIPVFQVSRFAAKALREKKEVVAELDFRPEWEESEFQTLLEKRLIQHQDKTAEEFLIGIFHKKLAVMLLKEANIPLQLKISDVHEHKIQNLIALCKHFNVQIESTNDFEQAQVCAGGVKTTEVNPQTMESIYEKDFYLVGEVLDVDGICGGYNLHWAWATGIIAGENAAKG